MERKITHGSLFSGIGGFDLAAEWMGWENLFHCEIDEYACRVLQKNFPNTRNIGDIKKHDWRKERGSVDVVSGGFPCQPFSTAARGRNNAEDLSRFMVDAIGEIKPKFVIGENVQREPIESISKEFESIGYRATYFRIAASEVGADHQRNRWWVIAYPDNKSELQSSIYEEMGRLQKLHDITWGLENYPRTVGVYDGLPHRMDRLKCLGNAIVPQVALSIFRAVEKVLNCT